MRNPSSSSSASASSPAAAATTTKTPCCTKVGLKRGPWTPEEDELLANYIKKEGEGRWRTLPKRAGLLRCGKSCRLRWMNYLRPSVKRGQIAPDEEDLILRLHRLLGNRWSLIAGRIPGRTDNEIKNYWNTHLSKKLISQGIDPRTHKPLNPNDKQSQSQTLHNNEQQQQPKVASSSKATRKSSTSLSSPKPRAVIISPPAFEEINTSGSNAQFINNKENNAYFQYTTSLDDQYPTGGPHGYTSLLNCDGSSGGMDLRGNNEEDEDPNYCNDDVFSFLNSFINDDAFTSQQQQLLQHQQQPNGILAASSHDPLISTLGWESALMSSSSTFNPNEPKRVD